jgi:single-stranded-DNA-specific exonuclease
MIFCNEVSIKGRRWRVASPPLSISGFPDIHEDTVRIASSRIKGDLKAFFSPSFKDAMPDPHVLKGMADASTALAAALAAGSPIGIVGDYDTDGATSVAILVRFLQHVGLSPVHWRIPHRMTDGYGPNDRIVDELETHGVTTLMIVDSGTAALEVVARARAKGMTVVILDHHEAQGALPDAIVVNPKRPDEDRSLDYLCTAGLAFLFCISLKRRLAEAGVAFDMDLRDLLGLVALGTVADMVPLVGLNRAYVRLGLQHMEKAAGIVALSQATGALKYTAETCGFVFAPSLNAAGRIDDMSIGAELLITDNLAVASDLAGRLHDMNQKRRALTKSSVDGIYDTILAKGVPNQAIVVHDETWHPGLVGLVASRLKEAFDVPVVAVGAEGKGSCRSIDSFDIGAAVIDSVKQGLLLKGGGHAMAAGITIRPDRFDEFRAKIVSEAGTIVHGPTEADLAISCGNLRTTHVKSYVHLEPFGQQNPRPMIAVVGGTVRDVKVLKGMHVKVFLEGPDGSCEAISFSNADSPFGRMLASSKGRRMDVVGTADINYFKGVETVCIKLKDAMFA